MFRKKLLLLLTILLFALCAHQDETSEANAHIIGFNPDKCICGWGWIITMDSDTIKSETESVGGIVGYEIHEAIAVYIELGDKVLDCSGSNPRYNKDYYEIKSIKIVEE